MAIVDPAMAFVRRECGVECIRCSEVLFDGEWEDW